MKTLAIILLSCLTLSAQNVAVPHWLTSSVDLAVDSEFFESLEITSDYIVIEAEKGDRIALWDNSGVLIFDYTFDKLQDYKLPIGYCLSGMYHLGVKKSGQTGKLVTLDIGKKSPMTVAHIGQ